MADLAGAQKRREGRPLKFESVEVLQKAIDAYFVECNTRQVDIVTKDGDVIKVTKQKPYTVSGLALALNTSRETLMNYTERPEFFDTIKGAKDKCLAWVETQLFEGTGAPAGVIFNLKNNYGWVDKQEVSTDMTSSDGTMSPKDPIDKSSLDSIIDALKATTASEADKS